MAGKKGAAMHGKATIAYRRVLETLADGPVERERLLAQVSPVIPFERALREAERARQRVGPAERVKVRTTDELVSIGRRALAMKLIGSAVRYGRVVREGDAYRLAGNGGSDAV